MAQLKSTSVVGNISATGNLLASKIIKLGGTANQILMADGSTMNADDVGAGTVTSVGVSSSSLTVTGSPITGAGTINIEHPTTTATTADIYKIGKDDKGHVVIGAKITPADLGLSKVYKYKGTKTWAELLALTSAEIGDVYSITNADPDGNTNADWACHVAVTAACTADNYANYWQSLGGKVDLSAYVQGPASAIDNAIARFNATTGKIIKDSKVTIDDSGNVIPVTSVASDLGSSGNIWKNAHIKAIHLRVGGQDTGTPNANAYGLGFWKPSFYTWYEYMAPNTGNSPTGAKAPQYGEVTTYARRSLIENTSGYGWIWEACGNTSNATPVGKMALSSNTGNLKVAGSVTANGFTHSGLTAASGKTKNDYVLLAGGGTKALIDFVTSDGTSVKANQVYFHSDLIFTKDFGKYIPDSSGSVTIPTLTNNMSLHDLLLNAFSEEKDPTVTNPAASFSSVAQGNKEVGTEVTLSYTASLSAGSYTYGPATGITAKSWEVTVANLSGSSTLTTNSSNFGKITVKDGDSAKYKITAKATYDAGAMPVTNLGNNCPSKQIAAGSKTAVSNGITGYRAWFYCYRPGGSTLDINSITSDTIRNNIGSNAQTKWISNNGSFTSSLSTTNMQQIFFAAPAGVVKSVSVSHSVNGAPQTVKKKTIYVKGNNNYVVEGSPNGMAYDLYYVSNDNPNTGAATYNIAVTK